MGVEFLLIASKNYFQQSIIMAGLENRRERMSRKDNLLNEIWFHLYKV